METAVASAVGVFCGADMIRIHDCELQRQPLLVASKLADYKRGAVC
ncbi:MAG: hypothetical protein Q9N62_12280 [Ghiorsea sp.]|nr:hypothetical protein [Ghiorsea sp.]